MKTTLRAALALGLFAVLAGPMTAADDKKAPLPPPVYVADDMTKVEAVLFANLKDVINKGVDLYNGGDIPGCYRLFEGTLRTVSPLVRHRPKLVEDIDAKLAAAEKESVMWRKAFTLRAALDKVRSDIRPKDAVGGSVTDKTPIVPLPGDEDKGPPRPIEKKATVPVKPIDPIKPIDEKKAPDDKKLLDDLKKKDAEDRKAADDKKAADDLKKKDDEDLKKKDDEELKKKLADDLKKKLEEEAKKKADEEAKKKADDEKKKEDEKKKDDEKDGEKKDGVTLLKQPKEVIEKDDE